MKEFSVTIIGTADASLNPAAPTACCLVKVDDKLIMVDVGIGAIRRLRALGVSPADINIILMTHWHLDHFLGLPDILSYPKRKLPLMLFGPRPSPLARFYINESLRTSRVNLGTVAKCFSKECGGVRIAAVPTSHDHESIGWVISDKEGKRKLVYSGDTRPVSEVLEAARGADLLIHEATYLDREAAFAKAKGHSTPSQVSKLAREANAGGLALIHIKRRNNTSEALEEARRIFPGLLVPSPMDKLIIDVVSPVERREKCGWGRIYLPSKSGEKDFPSLQPESPD